MICRCGGIGRHKGLKIPRPKKRTGSTPVSGTKKGTPVGYRGISGAPFLFDWRKGQKKDSQKEKYPDRYFSFWFVCFYVYCKIKYKNKGEKC